MLSRAWTHPRRLRGLILTYARPGADTPEAQATRESLTRLARSQGTDAVADLLLPRLLSSDTRQHHPAVSRGMAAREDTSRVLPGLVCPTLVIADAQDALIAPQVAWEYVARIPGAPFAPLPRAGHLPNLEQPRAFLQVGRQFLAPLS